MVRQPGEANGPQARDLRLATAVVTHSVTRSQFAQTWRQRRHLSPGVRHGRCAVGFASLDTSAAANSAIENAAADPEVAAVVRGHMARLEQCFAGALRTAVDLGEIPASVNVTAVAKGLVATASGMMVVGKANPDEEVLRIIVGNAFAGLM